MKRIFIGLIIIVLFCTGCSVQKSSINEDKKLSTGLWISYSEIDDMLCSADGFESQLEEAVEKCVEAKIENVYVHIRSHSEVLYKSEYFPMKNTATKYDGDVLEKIIECFHDENIKVHAWINPYRISASTEDWQNTLSEDSIVKKWLSDEDESNDKNVCIYNGIYLNPASVKVRRLIIDGIREVINNYSLDGIHFDDYFYPTTDEEFDIESYKQYCEKTENPLELDSFRRENINSLICSCYDAIKYENSDIVFSISPAASIERNFNEYYADVKHWIDSGYIDCIIPQLYFGFDYPDKNYRFDNLLNEWEKLISNNNVKLLIGLASYKIGTDVSPDNEEWAKYDDIISRQVKCCKNSREVTGYVLFSYDSVFSTQPLNSAQLNNLLNN